MEPELGYLRRFRTSRVPAREYSAAYRWPRSKRRKSVADPGVYPSARWDWRSSPRRALRMDALTRIAGFEHWPARIPVRAVAVWRARLFQVMTS